MAVYVGELFQYVRKPRDRIAIERETFLKDSLGKRISNVCRPLGQPFAAVFCSAVSPTYAFYFHLRAIHILKLYPPWARIYWRYRLLKYVKQ